MLLTGGFVLGGASATVVSGLALLEGKPRSWFALVRLPPRLHHCLGQHAQVYGRTLGEEVVLRLETSVEAGRHRVDNVKQIRRA